MEGSGWKSLGNYFLLILAVLSVGLVVVAVIVKADEEGEAEAGEEKLNQLGRPHPDGEVLMLKFREMFDYEEPPQVGKGLGSKGITPIVPKAANGKPIELEDLLALVGKLERSVEDLADGSTQVEQAVAWFLYEGRLHYVVLLRPFEQVAHELMKKRGEDLFLSFLDEEGERVLPPSAPEQIATRDLRVAAMTIGERRVAAGWVTYGELSVQGAKGDGIAGPKVGWVFSGALHARLRQLQRGSIVQDAAIRDPFRLDFEAKGRQAGR